MSISWCYLSFRILTKNRICLSQKGSSERPRPGRRLGGLTNLFSSRHRNSFSPNSRREELEGENAGDSSTTVPSSSVRIDAKPVSKSARIENRGTAVTPEVTKPDTGSGTVKPANSRVPNSQNRFSRNLSNSTTEDVGNANIEERDMSAEVEKSKRIPSSKQGSKTAISEQKKTGLLRRDKEKRGLLEKQDSEDGEKYLSANRLRSAPSSDSELVVHRNNRSRKDENKKSERIKHLDALSLR